MEEILARNTIQVMRDLLTVLQLEIDSHSSDAAINLECHKVTIIKSITAHNSIVSPLRKVPSDFLQVIFQKKYWDPATTSKFYPPFVFKPGLSTMENDHSRYAHLMELHNHRF